MVMDMQKQRKMMVMAMDMDMHTEDINIENVHYFATVIIFNIQYFL